MPLGLGSKAPTLSNKKKIIGVIASTILIIENDSHEIPGALTMELGFIGTKCLR